MSTASLLQKTISKGLPLGVVLSRIVTYQLFSLQNGTLKPLYGTSQIQGVKIEE